VYAQLDAPLFLTEIETAEMVKYADNAWHAVKVAFANEVGSLAKSLDVDADRVMSIFCQDTKLNLSPYYLKPRFAFGGSCLPKDVRALMYAARKADLQLPMLMSVIDSNGEHISRGLSLITSAGRKKIGVIGLTFKEGTDDLRESPMVEVVERLIGKGFDIRIYDRNIELLALTGSNRNFINEKVPHIASLLVRSVDAVLAHAEVVVVGARDPDLLSCADQIGADKFVVDFVRISQGARTGQSYAGICW
jgi:GDP-mannose 6-dehydrogenase